MFMFFRRRDLPDNNAYVHEPRSVDTAVNKISIIRMAVLLPWVCLFINKRPLYNVTKREMSSHRHSFR